LQGQFRQAVRALFVNTPLRITYHGKGSAMKTAKLALKPYLEKIEQLCAPLCNGEMQNEKKSARARQTVCAELSLPCMQLIRRQSRRGERSPFSVQSRF